jgi:hypothetical protein
MSDINRVGASAMTALVPIGAVVAKKCTCGAPACHRESNTHPRYRVVDQKRHYWPTEPAPMDWDYILERTDTTRHHRTSAIVMRDQYVILSLPTEDVLIHG